MSARCAVVTLALSQMACLVTDSVEDPQEANVPPSIVSRPGADNPLDKIVRFNVDVSTMRPDGGAPMPNELRFQVDVRDPNLLQRLQAKVFVDNVNIGLDREIPPSGTIKRPGDFVVPGALLTDVGCHKVELLISGAFSFGTRTPVDTEDFANAVWWVASTRSDGSVVVDMTLCNRT